MAYRRTTEAIAEVEKVTRWFHPTMEGTTFRLVSYSTNATDFHFLSIIDLVIHMLYLHPWLSALSLNAFASGDLMADLDHG